MKISISFLVFFIFVFIPFQPAAANQRPLIIATGTGALCGPVVIAQEKGFFRDQGLKTATTSLKTEKLAFRAYEKGGADAVVHSSIHIVRSNFDVSGHVVIGTIAYSDNQMRLLARKSAGITKVSDLKGKKIALPRAGFAHFFLEKFLLFNGLTLDDVDEVFVGKKQIPDTIGKGLAHATIHHGIPIAETKKILGEDYVMFQNPAIHRKTNQLLVSREWVENNRGQAKGILRAIIKAEKFIKTHTEESSKILVKAKRYDVNDMARTVRQEIDFYLSLKPSVFTELEGIEQWALANNIVARKTPRNYFDMVDSSLLEEVDPRRVTIIR
ncbi:MAG: ABC transporter substrate-binding protein [Desulfobacter sp.]